MVDFDRGCAREAWGRWESKVYAPVALSGWKVGKAEDETRITPVFGVDVPARLPGSEINTSASSRSERPTRKLLGGRGACWCLLVAAVAAVVVVVVVVMCGGDWGTPVYVGVGVMVEVVEVFILAWYDAVVVVGVLVVVSGGRGAAAPSLR